MSDSFRSNAEPAPTSPQSGFAHLGAADEVVNAAGRGISDARALVGQAHTELEISASEHGVASAIKSRMETSCLQSTRAPHREVAPGDFMALSGWEHECPRTPSAISG